MSTCGLERGRADVPVCWGDQDETWDMVYPEVPLTRLYSCTWDTCGLELDGAAAWCWGIEYTPPDWGLTSDGQILDRDGNPPDLAAE